MLAGPGFGATRESPDFKSKLDGTETFAVDFTQGLTPIVDQGNGYTYSRGAAGGTITDFEGLVKDVDDDEVMIDGVRRVENLLSTNAATVTISGSDFDLITGVTDRHGGNNAIRITSTGTAPSGNITIPSGEGYTGVVGRFYRYSCWFRFTTPPADGTISAPTAIVPGSTSEFISVSQSNDWVRYTGTANACAVAAEELRLLVVTAGDDPFEYEMCDWVIEDVTGQNNQNPSEYVSVGVGTGSELITNGDFSTNDTTGWTESGTGGTVGIRHGGCRLQSNAFENAIISQDIGATTDTNKLYAVTVNVTDVTSGDLDIYLGDTAGAPEATTNSTGVQTFVVRPGGTDGAIYFACDFINASDVTIDNISVKEINHGTNIDGSKYHNDDNRNTVDSNVVTEADGKNIQPGVAKGYSCWETRTNIVYNSNPRSTPWSAIGGAISDGTVSRIDGRVSARLTADNTTSTAHYLGNGGSFGVHGANAVFIFSGYFKYVNHDYAVLHTKLNSGAQRWVGIDFNGGNGAALTLTPDTGVTDEGYEYLGDGWYHVWGQATNAASGTTAQQVRCYLSNAAFDLAPADNLDTKAVDFDAPQSEEGSFPTPYIPTSGTAVTRPDSLLEYGVENWTDEGWVLVEFYWDGHSPALADVLLTYADNDDSTYFYAYIGPSSLIVLDFNGVSAAGSPESVSAGLHKYAVTWKDGEKIASSFDGGTVKKTSGTQTMPSTVDVFQIGTYDTTSTASFGFFNGNLISVRKGNTYKTDAELQEITS